MLGTWLSSASGTWLSSACQPSAWHQPWVCPALQASDPRRSRSAKASHRGNPCNRNRTLPQPAAPLASPLDLDHSRNATPLGFSRHHRQLSLTMSSSRRPSYQDPPLGHTLALMGWGLVGVFVASLLPALLGASPLSPDWMLGLSQGLVDHGLVALLGLALIHLSAYLNPADQTVERRYRLAAQLALPAALGFLLLIPLRAVLLWPSIQGPASQQANADQQFRREVAVTRTLLAQNLPSPQLRTKLLERVSGLRQSVGLPAAEGIETLIAGPSDALRSNLSGQLDEIEKRKDAQLRGGAPATAGQTSRLIAVSALLRTLLSSLALAIGFLAGSRWRHEDLSPLLIWQLNRETRQSGGRKAQQPGSRQAAKQFISQLTEEDLPSR